MKKTFYLLALLLFFSCNRDRDKEEETVPVFRTVIVYIAGDNDLSDDALNDIEEMKQGYSEAGVNLIVFADLQGQAPEIMKIGKNSAEIVLRYPEFNSAEAAQVQKTGCSDKVLPCPLYPCRLCLHLHLCWQAQPAKINRTRHSLVRTTGLGLRGNLLTGKHRRDGARPVSTLRRTTPPQTFFAETHAVRLYIAANKSCQS